MSNEKISTEVKPLNIIVAGSTRSGKSTVSRIIEEALEARGFHVIFKDPDGDDPGDVQLDDRVAALLKKGCPVKIANLQLGRAGMNALNKLGTAPTLQKAIITPPDSNKIIIAGK